MIDPVECCASLCGYLKESSGNEMDCNMTKPVSGGVPQSQTQISLLSYKDKLENWNIPCSQFRYDTFQKANNKGADQAVGMCRLVYAFDVRKP